MRRPCAPLTCRGRRLIFAPRADARSLAAPRREKLRSQLLRERNRFMRTLLALLAMADMAAPALAQGTVDFENRVPFTTTAERRVFSCCCGYVGGTPLVGTDFFAQLYYGTQGTPQESLIPVASPPAQFRAVTTSYPGTWGRGGWRTLEGILPGQTATLQVRVWDFRFAPTWELAVQMPGQMGRQLCSSTRCPQMAPHLPPTTWRTSGRSALLPSLPLWRWAPSARWRSCSCGDGSKPKPISVRERPHLSPHPKGNPR